MLTNLLRSLLAGRIPDLLSRRLCWAVTAGSLAAAAAGAVVWLARDDLGVPRYSYEVVRRFPHDPRAFCQGLAAAGGNLYESTGMYGGSTVRQIDTATGRIEREVRLDREYFGEGLTCWREQLVQLTWRKEIGLLYDRCSLQPRGRTSYYGEGWGLTWDGRHLVMSNGSATLRFLDPETWRVVRRVTVRCGGRPVYALNELEFVEGRILANVLDQDYILCIAPETGQVTGAIDLSALWPPRQRPHPHAVLNGIAYDRRHRTLFVTGKHWPWLYEIRCPQVTGAPPSGAEHGRGAGERPAG